MGRRFETAQTNRKGGLAVMQPEFQSLVEEANTHWYRALIALAFTCSIPLLLHYAINRPEGCPNPTTPSNPPLPRPNTLFVLRVIAMFSCARFAWIWFASLSNSWFYEISKLEAVAWCIYMFTIIPLWAAWEIETKEAMRGMRHGSSSNLS